MDPLISKNTVDGDRNPIEQLLLGGSMLDILYTAQESGIELAANDDIEAKQILIFRLKAQVKDLGTPGTLAEVLLPEEFVHFLRIQTIRGESGPIGIPLGQKMKAVVRNSQRHAQDFLRLIQKGSQIHLIGILQHQLPGVIIPEELT